MSLRVNHSISSIRSYTALSLVLPSLEKSIERLSSGLRINRAADDAAGLTISEKLRSQVRGLDRAAMNAQDGISMIQSAEGSLNETHSILQRMRELAVQAANDTLTSGDRLEIQKEVTALRDEINRIAFNTEFNTKKLLDGSQTALVGSSSTAVKGIVTSPVLGGGGYQVSIALLKSGATQMQRTGIFTVVDAPNLVADGSTQLRSIAAFYDANGVFILDTPQTLHMTGNSKTAQLVVEGFMSLDYLAAEIQRAATDSKGLGMTKFTAVTITTASTGLAGLGGYLQTVSGLTGEEGRFSFAGSQPLIDALGFSITRNSSNNVVHLSLTDAENKVTEVQSDSTRVSGLLNGVDIVFESQPAQIISDRIMHEGIYLSAINSFRVDLDTDWLVIAVDEGYWTMEGIANSINRQIQNAITLGPDNLPDTLDEQPLLEGLYAAVVDGQIRMIYEKPKTAEEGISNRVKISETETAATLGFINGTYYGFADSNKDQTKIEIGFRKMRVDDIDETTALRLSDGTNETNITDNSVYLLTDVLTASDMISFSNYQEWANDVLEQGGIRARIDQHEGYLVITSTRVGTENVNSVPTYESRLSLTIVNAYTFMDPPPPIITEPLEGLWSHMGLAKQDQTGLGDTNFRLHIVDKTPQYHIGANQSQIMNVTFGEMSALALGVNNLDMTTVAGAESALTRIARAIDIVASERSKLGAFQNRLEYAINNLRNTRVNTASAESGIRDADVAWEMIGFTRNQLVSQTATAMLAQANVGRQSILELIR